MKGENCISIDASKSLTPDENTDDNTSDSNANQVNKILFTEKVQNAIEQVGIIRRIL